MVLHGAVSRTFFLPTAARTIYAVKGGGGTIGADTISGRFQETSHLKLKQRGAVLQVANYVSFPGNSLGSEIKAQADTVALATIGAVAEGCWLTG